MVKKIFILVFAVVFILACQTGKEDAKKFADDYKQLKDKLQEKQDQVKTRDEYVAFKAEKKSEYEKLLQKYEKSPAIEEIEILRSKILLATDNTEDAEKKIDQLLAKKPELMTEAKMVKVQILLNNKKYQEAYDIFKDIESQVKDPNDLYFTYYYLGQVLDDNKVKEDYSKKFLESQQVPQHLIKYRTDMFINLASVAKITGDFEKARTLLKKGMDETNDEKSKKYLQNTLDQLDYIGKSAFPIAVGTWFNTDPLQLKDLKGQVVIIDFWATWCPSCRALTPSLVELYNENKDKGFTIIGYTRIHGKYQDDEADLGKVSREEELEHVKKYLERKQIPFPIAVADEKSDYEKYKISVLPTLIIIDRKGNIDFAKIGGGDIPFLKEKVKKLLTETI